ncbi:MAG: hypothetical protein CL920_02120 [Deltaproteobacteria bacterium]|nr:hypothetical protein [Deltaproteobacteria bacterium]|tara:strand:- start:103 stop:1023 length:921 start_codon:yes stop_codon:yes gene_type:complete
MIIAKWLKIPTITTFNTYFSHPDWVKAVGWFLPGWMGNLMWFWDRIFCNLADQAIAPTQIVRDDLLAHGFRKDIHVISYGAAYTNTPPTETTAQLRERFDVVGTKNILFIGRLSFEKNIDQLIDALALLVQKDPSYRLILVGEGPYEQHLREKLKQLNLLSYTTFLGPQDHQTIVEQNLYRLGDVFVTCSKAETLGITVLESMLQKVPVICVPEKGYRDLVEDHKTGFFVEAGSATSLSETLQHLFTHPKDLQKVIQPAYEYALKTHSTEQVVEQFKTLYTATLANKENSAQLKGRQKEVNHTGTD